MPRAWTFGYRTVQVWSFARVTCEQARSRVIADWPFSHSPAEAVSSVREISFSEVEPDWLYADSVL